MLNRSSGFCCTPSPQGGYISYVSDTTGELVTACSAPRRTVYTRCVVIGSHKNGKLHKVSSIHWSCDSHALLAVHPFGVKILECREKGTASERSTIENGSEGLGQIVTAGFVGEDHVLVFWEFGSTKLWDLNSSKFIDIPDRKTACKGHAWQMRPGNSTPSLFALLSRIGAEDHLVLHFAALTQSLAPVKLPTQDAQSLQWSPDGRWLAILDVPFVQPNLYIYTPDGHLFRSYSSSKEEEAGLGIKFIEWSPDGRLLALAKFDGKVELLNPRTFSPLAIIEHNTTIDQRSLDPYDQAAIWQEGASATNVRSYTVQPQPVPLPITKAKTDVDPKDLGVAEVTFSCDGSFLATRDSRMLNTLWLWNMTTLATHAVVIQHSTIRSLFWHPTRPETLMIDCAEGLAHIYDVSSPNPPLVFQTGMHIRAQLQWIHSERDSKPTVLVTEKGRFCTFFPEGEDEPKPRAGADTAGLSHEEDGAVEDSLLDVLSGRTPLPPKTQPSYTEMADLEMSGEEDTDGVMLEDTFREKRKPIDAQVEVDPLDDSQIF